MNIIAILLVGAFITLAIAEIALQELSKGALQIVADKFLQGADNQISPLELADLVRELQDLSSRNYLTTAIIISVLTALIGYIVAQVALAPTRNALAQQKQFIGNIAHELRTPLSIIKTNAEVTLLELGSSAQSGELRKVLRSNIEEIDRIADIINNLLSLSTTLRVEGIEMKNVDLGETLDRVLGNLRGLASSKGVEFKIQKHDERMVWGNPAALEQILLNIVKNAIIYSRKDGVVQITITPDYHGFIELVVEDHGIGIERADLERIFEPFYRADRSRTRATGGGSGLGLSIVNELVRIHRGKIYVKSTPNKGTTVLVHLPVGKILEDEGEGPIQPLDEVGADFSSHLKSRGE